MYLSTKSVSEAKWFHHFRQHRLKFLETEKYLQIFYVIHTLRILTINISTNKFT